MKLLIGMILAVAVAGVVAFLFFGPSVVRECWSDGSYPVWMLEKQDWDGASCVEEYPDREVHRTPTGGCTARACVVRTTSIRAA